MDGNVVVLVPVISFLEVSAIQLYFLMAVNKVLDHLALERHHKIPHWLEYYPFARFRGGCTSCSFDIYYSIALEW